MSEVGYRIKKIRIEKNMSQETLSKLSKVSRSIISGLESGRINVTTTATLLKLAQILEVKVEALFFDDIV